MKLSKTEELRNTASIPKEDKADAISHMNTIVNSTKGDPILRQLRQLQTQYDMLSGQASALIQGRRARVATTFSVLKNTNVRLNDTVNQLRSSRNFFIDIILLCVILGIAAYLYK
ncbi:hypothetical protein CsSME_00038645 [Camellia sinensis var. sinensis]